MPRAFVVLCLSLCASPAFAQSVYVGVAAGTDTTLASHFEVTGLPQPDRGGTVPALAVRAGLGLGDRWGAEVEVAYAMTLERTVEEQGGFAGVEGFRFTSTNAAISPILAPLRVVPSVTIESEQQRTAVNALGWFSYPASARFELVLLGGITFDRTRIEERRSFDLLLPANFPGASIIFGPNLQSTNVVTYDVEPIVGVEGRIAFGDHLRVVPGVRLSGVAAGWSIRPTAGIAWTF